MAALHLRWNWNSEFDPAWKNYKVELVSPTSIKLYSIDASGKESRKPTYGLSQNNRQRNDMATQATLSPQEFDVIKQHIQDIRTAMLTTQAPDGTMWFFTRQDSAKVVHIRHQPAIALGFSDPQAQVTVSTTGNAEVIRDQAKVDAL